MSEIAKTIDEMIRNSLAPKLKASGFKKKARNFLLEQQDHTKVVNVQASQWNEGSEGSFTINLGIYFPEVADAIDWFPVKNHPKICDCTINKRIGVLMPGGCDSWWEISNDTDARTVQESILESWIQYGEPWISHVSDISKAKSELIKQKQYFQAAGIALVQNDRAEAKRLLEKELKNRPLAKSKLNAWGKKHELL